MTSRERILQAMAAKPVDRVACCPRMWKFARVYYSTYDARTILRCAHDFGYDPVFYTGNSVPNIGVLMQTPAENMRVYFAAARKYGVRKALG